MIGSPASHSMPAVTFAQYAREYTPAVFEEVQDDACDGQHLRKVHVILPRVGEGSSPSFHQTRCPAASSRLLRMCRRLPFLITFFLSANEISKTSVRCWSIRLAESTCSTRHSAVRLTNNPRCLVHHLVAGLRGHSRILRPFAPDPGQL